MPIFRKRKKTSAIQGFTLMELMIVIVLLGSIFFITVPKIGRSVSVSDLDETARAIAAKLSATRDRAMGSGKDHLLLIDISRKEIRSIEAEKKEDDALNPEKSGGAFRLPGKVAFSDVQFEDGESQATGTAEILVTKEGYARYSAIHLSDEDLRMTVFVEPFLGGVRIVHEHENMELREP